MKRTFSALAAASLSLSLAACNSSGDDAQKSSGAKAAASSTPTSKKLSARDMWNKSQDRWNSYRSLKVVLEQTNKKNKKAQSTVFGDMDGRTQEASISSDGAALGAKVVDGHAYMKMDRKMVEAIGGATSSLSKKGKPSEKEINDVADKWIDSDKKKPETLDYLKEFKTNIQKDDTRLSKNFLSGHATVSEDTVNGKPAWKITSADKKFNAWVTRDHNYDMVKLSGPGLGKALDPIMSEEDNLAEEMSISDINKDFGIKKPTGSELAKFSESGKSGKSSK